MIFKPNLMPFILKMSRLLYKVFALETSVRLLKSKEVCLSCKCKAVLGLLFHCRYDLIHLMCHFSTLKQALNCDVQLKKTFATLSAVFLCIKKKLQLNRDLCTTQFIKVPWNVALENRYTPIKLHQNLRLLLSYTGLCRIADCNRRNSEINIH